MMSQLDLTCEMKSDFLHNTLCLHVSVNVESWLSELHLSIFGECMGRLERGENQESESTEGERALSVC